MFAVFEHEGLFLQSSTEMAQVRNIHSEMEVGAHFAVHAHSQDRCAGLVCHDKTAMPASALDYRHSCFAAAVARDWQQLLLTYQIFPTCRKLQQHRHREL